MSADVNGAFELSSVIHLIRPLGARARDLETMRIEVARVDAATLFFHALQVPLRRADTEEPPLDDFSTWVRGVLQDSETAERIAFAVQSRGGSPDELRAGLLEVFETVSEKDRIARDAPEGAEFEFLTSESVPVPTGAVARTPAELMAGLDGADLSAWFFHLVEQPWFEGGRSTLTQWLTAHGEVRLAELMDDEARSGRGLEELRRRILRRWRQSKLRSRVAAAAAETEHERRETARAAVAGLVRRITRSEDKDDARRGS